MSVWSGGYVTDVDYVAGYHAEQSAYLMVASCLVAGIALDVDPAAEGFHYMELGCGRGRNAIVCAAANPHWRVTALDFNPAAIAEARTLARAAGLRNVTFIEADLSVFAASEEARALPPVDAMTLHGVWSWVPLTVRDGIVRLLQDKVRPGGMVHVSYNVLPGLQGALGMQRLIRGAGQALADRSDRQVLAGRDVARELMAAEAMHLSGEKSVGSLLGMMDKAPVAYLAHEYMNATWYPCFHEDVADAMAPARLDYACSTRIPENFPALMMTEAQRAVHDRFDSLRMRELVKDMCAPRGLRHDLYVRGARRSSPAQQTQALRSLWIGLAVHPDKFIYRLEMPAGQADLGQDYYGPVVRALADGPRQVGDLLGLAELQGKRENPAELVGMMVGTLQALIVPQPQAGPTPGLRACNAVLARAAVDLSSLGQPAVAASLRFGSGLMCRAVEMFLIERIGATGGGVDPAIWAGELGAELSEEERERLRVLLVQVLQDRLTVWQLAGVV